MEKTKIGIIGLGGIAQIIYLPIIKKLKTAEITAVSEIAKSRMNHIADKFGIEERYTDYREMLTNSNIEAVIIATPTDTHHSIAIDALNAGKHILIEKPAARNFDEAKAIQKVAKKNRKIVMVGMNLRFRPDAMLLKSFLGSKEIGDIYYVRASWIRQRSTSHSWAIETNKSGGGALMDLGLMLLDLGVWLLDYPDIKRATVSNFNFRTETVEDSSAGLIRLERDITLGFEVSWSLTEGKDKLILDFFGTTGTAHLFPLNAYKHVGDEKVYVSPLGTSVNTRNFYNKSFENEIKHFVASIRNGVGVVSSIDGAIHRMKMMDILYQSANEKREIVVE